MSTKINIDEAVNLIKNTQRQPDRLTAKDRRKIRRLLRNPEEFAEAMRLADPDVAKAIADAEKLKPTQN
ncbi:MAG: hypothetical protein NC037_01270 [Bacteroides sp.]|nr:hypothetical protein [Bacillota bacterium]MCM1393946.1 hypothetical protein [[Eubacterium] siraeum]MCM1455146.1 hypothetical protein [Bacteroides sp.]